MNKMQQQKLFNSALFENLRVKFQDGLLTAEKNVLSGIIEPPAKLLYYMQSENSVEYQKNYNCGVNSIKNNEFAIAIVNGGMATRFGGIVKGIVKVFDDKSFLQLKIENALKISKMFGVNIYVFIMNSIFTHNDTVRHFEENNYFGYDKDKIIFFNQYYFKRVDLTGEILKTACNESIKYGSGHGDFFYAFKEFVYPDFKNKIKYIFYSNVDNLGAYIEPAILGWHIEKNKEITVELAEKNKGDKGGAPAVVDDKPCIVEEFKFPKTFNQDSIKVFNTATYIFSTEIFENNIDLPFYIVKKEVEGSEFIQFERLAGDLTMFFDTNFLVIDRNLRFYPVKTIEDLENSREKLKNILADKI